MDHSVFKIFHLRKRKELKRPILLLEVLIAFAIIVLCIFPLIYPHAAMAKSQREFVRKIELDHAVTLLFAQIYQDLYTNRIPWPDIENNKRFEIQSQDLQKYNDNKKLLFRGIYWFEIVKHKPNAKTPQETNAYLINLNFTFYPENEKKEKEIKKKNLTYSYTLFVLRDLRPVKNHQVSPGKK